jgi:hypothetical protein
MTNTLDAIISELLSRGLDDWVHLTDAIPIARLHNPDADVREIKRVCLQAIKLMLERGLVSIGDLIGSGKEVTFKAWPNPPDAATARISQVLLDSPGLPQMSGEYWLSNTNKGDEIARSNEPREQK